MPPQIMTGATHLQTEKQHKLCVHTHVEANPGHDSMLHGAASMEPCKTCLMKRMYKKAMTRATTKPLQTRKRQCVRTYVYISSSSYTLIQLVRVCVCVRTYLCAHTHSHK